MSTDDQIEQMLEELGKAVVRAMSESDDVAAQVKKIHNEGFSLYLVLDCKQDRERGAELEIIPKATKRRPLEASFRLGGEDVALLKSLGIDATRPGKRRRSS